MTALKTGNWNLTPISRGTTGVRGDQAGLIRRPRRQPHLSKRLRALFCSCFDSWSRLSAKRWRYVSTRPWDSEFGLHSTLTPISANFPISRRGVAARTGKSARTNPHAGAGSNALSSAAAVVGRLRRTVSPCSLIYLHHCCSHGTPSLFPSIFVPGQFLRKKVASSHEVI